MRRESVTSPTGFLAKVTCWQQRVDPETEVMLKKKKQRPVSIAGEVESVSLNTTGGGLRRVPSLGSLTVDRVTNRYHPVLPAYSLQAWG